MNSNERLEVEAHAFQHMTGRTAPFKDPPAAEGPMDMVDRLRCWSEWKNHHAQIMKAMFYAFEKVLRP